MGAVIMESLYLWISTALLISPYLDMITFEDLILKGILQEICFPSPPFMVFGRLYYSYRSICILLQAEIFSKSFFLLNNAGTVCILRNRGHIFFPFDLKLPWTWLVLNEWKKNWFQIFKQTLKTLFLPLYKFYSILTVSELVCLLKKPNVLLIFFVILFEESKIFCSDFLFLFLFITLPIGMMLFIFHWYISLNNPHSTVKRYISTIDITVQIL